MPRGWRAVVCSHWPDEYEYGCRRAPAEVSVVQVLGPNEPDPTPQQLDQLEQLYARYGGVAHAAVLARYWYGWPVLSEAQTRALMGLP